MTPAQSSGVAWGFSPASMAAIAILALLSCWVASANAWKAFTVSPGMLRGSAEAAPGFTVRHISKAAEEAQVNGVVMGILTCSSARGFLDSFGTADEDEAQPTKPGVPLHRCEGGW